MSDSQDTSERELLTMLRGGCTLSFEKLYDKYKYRLTANILTLVKDEEVTQDILQELFIKVWSNRDQIDINLSFQSYLYKIARNLVIDKFRKSARDRRLEEKMLKTCSTLYTHIEESIEQKENSVFLEKIMSTLPPQRRLVYTLCKIEGKSYKEVGETLGISINTVNDHIKKANASLKNHLSQSDYLLSGLICIAILSNL